jgi:nucleotide-binding universal stress UspA family protein
MKILVAIDGSDHALRSVNYVIDLVEQLRHVSSVTLISVHDDTGLRHAKGFVGNLEVANYLRELSEEELRPALALLKTADVQCDVEIRVGHVAQQIVEFADEGVFDLVVMGAKGRGAFADMILGSVAQRVAAMTKQAVLLIK